MLYMNCQWRVRKAEAMLRLLQEHQSVKVDWDGMSFLLVDRSIQGSRERYYQIAYHNEEKRMDEYFFIFYLVDRPDSRPPNVCR